MRIAIFHSFILIVIYLIYSDAGNLNFYTNYLRNVHVWVFSFQLRHKSSNLNR